MSQELYGLPSDEELAKISADLVDGGSDPVVETIMMGGKKQMRDNYAIPLLKTAHEKIEQLEKENKRLKLIVKQYKSWGTDECPTCQDSRITLFAANKGVCYLCNPDTRKEIEDLK